MTVPSKFQLYLAGTVLVLLISCSNESPKFPSEEDVEKMYSSYSSTGSSSSGIALSSSSVDISSSGEVSSSSVGLSSSSVDISSSSEQSSSSFSAQSSSSVLSSSSVDISSSSEQKSSSSVEASSNSMAALCGTESYDTTKQFCDDRDNKIYGYVTIGSQIWMAENLKYKATDSKCVTVVDSVSKLKDINDNCTNENIFYNWAIATNVCPEDWYLPSNAEWDDLMVYITSSNSDDEYSDAGKYLKATSGWDHGGDGLYNFDALPVGFGDSESYFDHNTTVRWWSNDSESDDVASIWIIYDDKDYVEKNILAKEYFLSVRCIKDQEP